MPTILDQLKYSADELKHLESASLDSEVILSYVLNKPREYLLTHGEDEVSPAQEKRFTDLTSERAKHKPVAYLIHCKEFYGRDFYVDERVHIPRPATEDLLDFIRKTIPPDFSGTIADIGAGSGCIAITLAMEFPNAKIIATDISLEALAVAKQNAAGLNAKIDFYNGDLLSALPQPVDIIVTNPPYGWEKGWTDNEEVGYQPKISYESGIDGLDAIKQIISQLPQYLHKGGQAFIEFDPRRHRELIAWLKPRPYSWEIKKDSAQWDRLVRIF